MLAIGCINLTSLMLARTLRRRREMAVRLALGASPRHVAGLLALESALLVAGGAALSIVVTQLLDRLVLAQGASMFGNFDMNLAFDARVWVFFGATVAAVMCALAGGAAWQARRLCRSDRIAENSRSAPSSHGRVQKILIAAQIALTLALAAGGDLLGSSLRWLYNLDLGVNTSHVWDAMLASRPEGYSNFAPGPYYRELVRQVETIPGIRSVVLADFVPFLNSMYQQPVTGIDSAAPEREVQARIGKVTDGFFSMMGMRIEEGKDFRREAPTGAEPEAIVNEALARHLGGARTLIGRHIRVGTSPEYQRMKVVAVVSNAQLDLSDPLQGPPMTVYIDSWQHPSAQAGYPVLLLKTTDGSLPAEMLRRVVDREGREYVERARSLDAEKDGALVENRVMAYLAGAFATLALALAATGLFGLLSYQAASRTSEIGIRMALGARPGQIQWMMVRQISGLMGAGLAAGVALALIEGRAITGLLFGVHPSDPVLLALPVITLAVTALAAAWVPARRSALLDPVAALRHE